MVRTRAAGRTPFPPRRCPGGVRSDRPPGDFPSPFTSELPARSAGGHDPPPKTEGRATAPHPTRLRERRREREASSLLSLNPRTRWRSRCSRSSPVPGVPWQGRREIRRRASAVTRVDSGDVRAVSSALSLARHRRWRHAAAFPRFAAAIVHSSTSLSQMERGPSERSNETTLDTSRHRTRDCVRAETRTNPAPWIEVRSRAFGHTLFREELRAIAGPRRLPSSLEPECGSKATSMVRLLVGETGSRCRSAFSTSTRTDPTRVGAPSARGERASALSLAAPLPGDDASPLGEARVAWSAPSRGLLLPPAPHEALGGS
jgi:hypothetical protein